MKLYLLKYAVWAPGLDLAEALVYIEDIERVNRMKNEG